MADLPLAVDVTALMNELNTDRQRWAFCSEDAQPGEGFHEKDADSFKMLVLSRSTDISNQTFSVMKLNESRLRSSLNDDHLSAVFGHSAGL